MKHVFKFTRTLFLASLLLIVSCSNDDDATTVVINLQDVEVTINENPTNGDVIGTVQSNSSSSLNYSITSQTPAGALAINANTGELTVADATLFDYETNPSITAIVAATGAENTANVTITVNNVNELNIQDFSVTIDENPSNGVILGTVQATGDGTLSYSITSQTPAGALAIDANTGELTVADTNLFDYETNPTLTATIAVDNSGNTQNLTATINLNDLNEIGEYKFGGIIFWINATGDEGLVLALNNLSTNSTWGCIGTVTGATGTAIGTGEVNTNTVISAGCASSGSAVEQVSNLNLNGYDDWFLPSSGEWAEVYNNLSVIQPVILSNGGDDLSLLYWCSNENDAYNVAAFLFTPPGDGTTYSFQKSSTNIRTRAVRAWVE
ncbi:MAG: cadherin repeat domain-containing protein [Flavobacteriaceae bacterium]|nr:cadherin repeat domain-containing protein [Flavobacteriaceae bacterium]